MADVDLSMAATTTATDFSATSFEPVLNVPSLVTFVVIMTMALVLRLRVGAISDAAERRIEALVELRDIKSKELSNEVTPEQVAFAIATYETALQEEEGLRTLLPGVRLRAPNNPVNSEQDQQAARQFLNSDILPTPVEESQRSNLGPVAIGVMLTFLFGSQLLLFLFLSMDDTTATEVFNSIADSTTDPAAAALLVPASPDGTVAETIGDLVGLE